MFYALWIGFLIVILYSFFKSCFRNADSTSRAAPPRSGDNPRPSSGWFPGGYFRDEDHTNPPPPYTKHDGNSSSQGWQPGFWTGTLIGGLANHLWNRNSNAQRQASPRQSYDWERFRQPQSSLFGSSGVNSRDDDRGEGSSNLGTMRRSTGIGRSNVR
jgi:hypothetical protein